MNAIDTLFFDLGNVLFAFDYGRFHRSASNGELLSRNAEEPLSRLTVELESGRLTEVDFLNELLLLYPTLQTTDRALLCWNDIFTPIESTIACVRTLHKSGKFHLGVISNTSSPHMQCLRQLSDVLDCFDSLTLSYEVGIMKPDAAIYQAALRQAGTTPENCVFFDDRADNVEAARKLGIQAFQVTQPEDVTWVLKQL